jgi:hypothetical protein
VWEIRSRGARSPRAIAVFYADVARARRVKTESTPPFRKKAAMHAPVNHLHAPKPARRKPVAELADWLLDAAVLMVFFSFAALAVAYVVLLIVL